MPHKKQVALNGLTIVALLLATLGLGTLPATALVASPTASSQSTGRPQVAVDPDTPTLPPYLKGGGEEQEGDPAARDDWFYSSRAAHDPNVTFSLSEAAALRAQAAEQLSNQIGNRPTSSNVFSNTWTSVGPNPMVLVDRGDNSFDAMAGRIGALAIRSSAPYTMYLGGAQGGVWTLASPYTGTWTAKTDNLGSLAIGALALAPSNEDIVYVGTGEGALSGDSYFGDGILKSTDGGNTFFKVSASGYFTKVSISKIVVANTNPNTLYAGTLRGRGGSRRTSPPDA